MPDRLCFYMPSAATSETMYHATMKSNDPTFPRTVLLTCWVSASVWVQPEAAQNPWFHERKVNALLGKVGEAKSWRLPTRKTPACVEAALSKSRRSMEAAADPSTLLCPWRHPSPLCPGEPVLSVFCCSTFHTTTSAFRSQRATEDRVCRVWFFQPAKPFKLFCI